MSAARVYEASAASRLSGTGVTQGSLGWMQPVSVCMPAFRPAAWILRTIDFSPSRPLGNKLGLGS